MRACAGCGNQVIRDEARFCDLCGGRLPELAPVAPPPPARPSPGSGSFGSASRLGPARPPNRFLSRRSAVAPSGPPLSWKDLETLSEVPDELNIEGSRWVRVDDIELRNRESEVAHDWCIEATREIYQERGDKPYPDGRVVNCRGYLHKGGFARFSLRNLTPGAPVLILRQVWAEGREVGELFVGEYTAGAFQYTEMDLHRPLRNRVHQIPRSLVQTDSLTVEQEDLGSDNGLYYFHMWFFQPGDAVDARASQQARSAAASGVASAAPMARSGVALSQEALARMGRGLPETIKLLAKEWDLVDYLAFGEPNNPDDHSFAVYEAENYFTTKLRSTYPDGEPVEDAGILWSRGYAEWTVGGCLAYHDLLLVARVDTREGGQVVEVSCDDQPAGTLVVEGRDPVHRWRNVSHAIPARLVSDGTARLRLRVPEGTAGMNLFRLWFFAAR